MQYAYLNYSALTLDRQPTIIESYWGEGQGGKFIFHFSFYKLAITQFPTLEHNISITNAPIHASKIFKVIYFVVGENEMLTPCVYVSWKVFYRLRY